MITKNFKAMIAAELAAGDTVGLVSVTGTDGSTKYLSTYFSGSGTFPMSPLETVRFSSSYSSAGIYIGSGNTAPTENDYAMETLITTGMTSSTPAVVRGVDGNGNPYKVFTFTLTNNTASDIVVKEIGYVQKFLVATTLGGVSSNTHLLLDRTLLEAPLTIPANSTGVIQYTLKTIMS